MKEMEKQPILIQEHGQPQHKRSKLLEKPLSLPSKEQNYNHIPKGYNSTDADYFHCTSNNTIFGTQMKEFPKTYLLYAI
jgi:phosphoserine aminotransferase